MSPPDRPDNKRSNASRFVFSGLGLVLLTISTLPPLLLLSTIFLSGPRGNDFGSRGMAIAAITAVVVFFSPIAGGLGLFLIRKFSNSKLLYWAGWITTLPTFLVFAYLAIMLACSMRPLPKYNSQDYQHLIGRRLREVRSELDTRQAVSGSGHSNGVSYDFVSLPGMEIRANREGIITEVKEGLQN